MSAGRQTARLGRLVDDMLDVARINTGKLRMNLAPTDLCTLAHEVAERIRPQFDAAKTPLTLDCVEGVTVQVDRDRMEQVLLNQIVESHGGRIRTDSELGGGAKLHRGVAAGGQA